MKICHYSVETDDIYLDILASWVIYSGVRKYNLITFVTVHTCVVMACATEALINTPGSPEKTAMKLNDLCSVKLV